MNLTDLITIGKNIVAAINALAVGPWDRGDGLSERNPMTVSVDMNVGTNATIYAGASVDYNIVTPSALANLSNPVSSALWDVALWDVDIWPGSSPNRLIAHANSGSGVAVAPTVLAVVNGQTGQPSNCYIYGGAIMIEQGSSL